MTTTTLEVVAEWVEAFPDFGIPGDLLEICGVVHGPRQLDVVVADPVSGDTWPTASNAVVGVNVDGRWCWEGEYSAEMQTGAGDRYPIEPGMYAVNVYYEDEAILHTTLQVSSPELVAEMPPSQSPEDALRDGVIPEIAELPFYRRVRSQVEVTEDEGIWMLTGLSRAVEDESMAAGCGIGDPNGVYPIDIVCTFEYGEILLVDDAKIVKAYPMPGAPPSWIHITGNSVYSGHIGDGGLPDSTLVRIDRETLEAIVVVIPTGIDSGGSEWLPTWHIAPDSFSPAFWDAVHINSGKPGTPVESWIGVFDVDLAAIDNIIDTVTTNTSAWPPGTVPCSEVEDDFQLGVDDHAFSLDQGLVSYWRSGEEVFIQFVDDPTCRSGSAAWDYLIRSVLDPDTLHRNGELCDFYSKVAESDPPPANTATVLDHLVVAEELCP